MQQEKNQKCTNELTQLSDEDVLTEAEYNFSYGFSPLGVKNKKCLCRILGISPKHVLKAAHNAVSQMGPPLSTKQIASDGNCLFRAISYSVSNRQEHYKQVRNAVVNHMMKSSDALKSFLRPQYSSVEEYIKLSGIEKDAVWGTELEILAAADLLKTDIFTFHEGSWIKYSASQIRSQTDTLNEAVYLKHIMEGHVQHYESVISVKTENPPQPKSEIIKQRYRNDAQWREKIRKRSSLVYHNDEKYREQAKQLKRARYDIEDEFREKAKQKTKENYEKDNDYRKKVKRVGKEK